jgi:serine/threonine-protein kinase
VEAIATGEIDRQDQVEYMGREAMSLENIEDLARFLPPTAICSNPSAGLGTPDYAAKVTPSTLVSVLFRVIESDATGVLFAEGLPESGRSTHLDGSNSIDSGRKDLYFLRGRLHHVASNNASELLGEYLVRRGTIAREELDFALAVLPRYSGRMGETLVSLGLVSSLDVFRAIRDQGRDRVVDLFRWTEGKLTFFVGQTTPHVEFPLDFDLIPLIFAGVEAAETHGRPMDKWRSNLDVVIRPSVARRHRLEGAHWPDIARHLLVLAKEPKPVRDLLVAMAQAEPPTTADDVLRALDVMLIGGMLTRM